MDPGLAVGVGHLVWCVFCIALCLCACGSSQAADLEIELTPRFSGDPLQTGSLRYQTAARETFSVTRLSYILSGFALEGVDGSWYESTNTFAWIDLERSRSSLRVAGVPAGVYRSLRFHVGLDEEVNRGAFTNYSSDHPLNPNLNGLHWGWQGGYVFLAIEGRWRNAAGVLDGWSYHLARETNRVRINLGANLDLTRDARLELDFDLASLLRAPRPVSFEEDGSTTHSRDGDPVAAALVANLPGAFRVRSLHEVAGSKASPAVKPLYLPEKYTPATFQMGATFPMPDLPRDNPLIEERVSLGQKLFHETALSRDGTQSCASCHEAWAAFADSRRYSVGVQGKTGTRNAMPLFNLAWKKSFFWDGRASSLREQALMPIQDHAEMDEALTNVVAKLARVADYTNLFAKAFGSPEITTEKVGLAIESFELTLTSFDAKFDRVLRGSAELTNEEKRGFELFMTEYDPRRGQYGADCFHCHGGPLFQSQTFANNGLEALATDRGRARVTGNAGDEGKFATPSLRNIALTAPYMHDGRFSTLDEVIEHYSSGVKRCTTLDPNLAKHPDGGLHLEAGDKRALVAFLNTLTDERFRLNANE